jgi:hypothetical protein
MGVVDWPTALASALGGGIVAALISDWLRVRRFFFTAVLLVSYELAFNQMTLTVYWGGDYGYKFDEERIAELEAGDGNIDQPLFDTSAWKEHRAALGRKIARKNLPLWTDLVAVYNICDGSNIALRLTPFEIAFRMYECRRRLERFDRAVSWRGFRHAARTGEWESPPPESLEARNRPDSAG